MRRQITQIDVLELFEIGIRCTSSAFQFLFPVRENGAVPLVYPDGEKQGQPIVDDKGRPIGENGIVFWNGKDKTWQAAPCGGVVIINQVPPHIADGIISLMQVRGLKPNTYSVPDLKSLLTEIALQWGLMDHYNSTRTFITEKMISIGHNEDCFGLYQRKQDICLAILLKGNGEFEGPAATPQQFENDAVLVQQGDSIRLVQTDVFLDTYTRPNGSLISLEDLPAF